jgi:hypothetical protein
VTELTEGDERPAIRHGRKPGDARVVVARPDGQYFRLGEDGTVVAKAAAIEPDRRFGPFQK